MAAVRKHTAAEVKLQSTSIQAIAGTVILVRISPTHFGWCCVTTAFLTEFQRWITTCLKTEDKREIFVPNTA
jgi:hypothetical protein